MIYGIQPTKFFETFVALAVQKGLSPSVAAEEAGLNRSAVTAWKKGRIPGEATLSKLTAYFGVTKQYLLEGPPDELVTESKVEFYDEQGVSSVEGKVSSADALEEGSRLENRTFLTLAVNLLKIYCPNEDADSLKKKLKMSSAVIQALEDERLDKVLVNTEWNARFYSLLEDKNIAQILDDLKHAQHVLEHQWRMAISNKIPQIIWDYMYQKRLDFEFVKPEPLNTFNHKPLKLVKLRDSGKHWVFFFAEFRSVALRLHQTFMKSNFKWINDIPDVERLIIMLIDVPNSVSNDEFAKFQKNVYMAYLSKVEAMLPNIQFFSLHINSMTGETMEEEQIGLNLLTDTNSD